MPGGTPPTHDFRDSIGDLYGTTESSQSDPPSSPSHPPNHAPTTPTDGSSRRTRNGPSDRYRREREHVHSSASHREIVRLLIDNEYEVGKLRKALYNAFERITAETNRANENERARVEMLGHFRTLNDSRAKALREAEKATQELRMYQIQYANAQREINRAQEVVKLLQEQREDAERSAARSRRIARELNQNRLVTEAREEGRRLGFKAGFARAQQEVGAIGDDESILGGSRNIDDAMMAMDLREPGSIVNEEEEDSFDGDTPDADDHPAADDHDSRRSPPPPEPVPISQPVPQPALPPSRSPNQTPAVLPFNLPIPSQDALNNMNGIRRPPSVQPPDNYIPQTTEEGTIALPPPFEFTSGSRYPTLAPPSPHSPSLNLPPILPDIPEPQPLNVRPPSSTSQNQPIPKTNSSHSRRHSIGSGSTSSRISQNDLLKAAPSGSRPQRELSIIREDGNSSRMGTPSHQRSKSVMTQSSFGGMRTDGISEPPVMQQDPVQVFIDPAGYPNEHGAQEWRATHHPPPPPAQQYRDRPPRHPPRPANLTVPAPLNSPPAVGGPSNGNGYAQFAPPYMRSTSDSSSTFYNGMGGGAGGSRRGHTRASSNSLASSLGKPIAGLFSSLRSKKEPRESMSEEITINVDPPSGPSSGRTNFQQPLQPIHQDFYLSPQQGGGAPLPSTSQAQPRVPDYIETVPNTPEMPKQYWPSNGRDSRSSSRAPPNGPREPSPSRSPSPHYVPFPNSQPPQQPQYHSREYASREPFRPTSKASLRRAASPASMASTARVGGHGHKRSMSATGSVVNGGTPVSVNRVLAPGIAQSTSAPSISGGGGGHALHRVASNASMTSQGSYNPDTYLDPAWYPPEGR
ncbi:hypothetical protein ONZ45_g9002 [Pleurotus djamor]|nr:hypothetical protein ONZ45_g9002 [Pleurotus djamor]